MYFTHTESMLVSFYNGTMTKQHTNMLIEVRIIEKIRNYIQAGNSQSLIWKAFRKTTIALQV